VDVRHRHRGISAPSYRGVEPCARTGTREADEDDGESSARLPTFKRIFDVLVAVAVAVVLIPALALIALAVKVDSPGPVFFRCRRTGFHGRTLWMLKFRKMHAAATGPELTVATDDRLTRVGRVLTATKLDELPQLWNVLKGEMSIVGPRPEDPKFVSLRSDDYQTIVTVRPGITGLCQLAFAREGEILDPADRLGDYVERLLPMKVEIDKLYATRRTFAMDLEILTWTFLAVVLRRSVAVNRQTGRLSVRARPAPGLAPEPAMLGSLEDA